MPVHAPVGRLSVLLLAAGLVPVTLADALAQASGQRAEAVEVSVAVRDASPRCDPGELRLPADATIDLRVRNGGARPIAFRSSELFKSDRVSGATNAEPEKDPTGYVVAAGHTGQMLVRTPPAGRYNAVCADPGASEGQALSLEVVK